MRQGSVVIRNPDRWKRKSLWEDLKIVIPDTSISWVVIGDFNAIRSSNEKRGGRQEGMRCSLFGNFLEEADLHYLGFKCLNFTWHSEHFQVFG
ncbi:hypothetical protein PVK06_010331 [Gossypium arboreum]|uniref:Uncharacterized protein n=1 Tax=Gossypium arboreum TaxID=29729 RepID=A0ABR0Q5M8_GOSAR|nr:hypothetical protein PVK06_010331 [Gossypium arboreum]